MACSMPFSPPVDHHEQGNPKIHEANAVYKQVLGTDILTKFANFTVVVMPLRGMLADSNIMFRWLLENQCGCRQGGIVGEAVHVCRTLWPG